MTDSPLDQLLAILADACCSTDPIARLQDALVEREHRLAVTTRAWLATIDVDGLRVSSEASRQHRLNLVLTGDAELASAYQVDPMGFRDDFLLYVETVAPRHSDAAAEARAFRDYMELLG